MNQHFEFNYIISTVILLFLLINFNLEIGVIYGLMALIDWMSYYIAFDRKVFGIVPIEKQSNSRLMSLAFSVGAYAAFVFGTGLLLARFTPVTGSVVDFISSLASQTFSATPILYGSTFIKLAVWGIMIPILETRFFFRTLLQWGEYSASLKSTNLLSFKTLFIALFFGALFAVFHIVAKGITNNYALFVTVLFGAASVVMVLALRQVVEAIFLHIIYNTIATMYSLQMGFFAGGTFGFSISGVMVLGSVILISWFLIFQEIPFVNFLKQQKVI